MGFLSGKEGNHVYLITDSFVSFIQVNLEQDFCYSVQANTGCHFHTVPMPVQKFLAKYKRKILELSLAEVFLMFTKSLQTFRLFLQQQEVIIFFSYFYKNFAKFSNFPKSCEYFYEKCEKCENFIFFFDSNKYYTTANQYSE